LFFFFDFLDDSFILFSPLFHIYILWGEGMDHKTSIILITYNNLSYTKDCIASILKYTKKDTYELIVVDNLSSDGTREWLSEQKGMKVLLNDENVGFPKGCNLGIELSDLDNDILFLNNDTIVTKNWLDNLKIALYSDSKVGAVGSVCNHNENLQGCDFTYDDFGVMQELAEKNNISDPAKWEKKNFLIGFCLLVKREVMDKIKVLDENYSPGYIEDNDLSLRIIEEGYDLLLCHDSFIHHYLGSSFRKDLNKFYPILYKNRAYFEKKWGFDTFSFDALKSASLKLVDRPKKILELDAGIGTTLLKLGYMFPGTVVHGVEVDSCKRSISCRFTNVFSSFDDVDLDYDFILIGNRLEQEENPKLFLENLRKHLKDGGFVIGEISNPASIFSIVSLLKDEWYYHHTSRNTFTIGDIEKLFLEAGYNNPFVFSWYQNLDEEQETIVKHLEKKFPKNYNVTYYSFRFQK